MIVPLLLAAAVQPAMPPSTPVTIEEVRRDPRRWDGKWIQLEGWINRCWPIDCTIAENLSDRPGSQGMSLSFEAQDSFDAWVKPMLPLRARVVARIDARCLVDEVCIDRAPVLRGMIVQPLQWNVPFREKVE